MRQEYPILDEALKVYAALQLRCLGNVSLGGKDGHRINALGMSLAPQDSCRSFCAAEAFCPVPISKMPSPDFCSQLRCGLTCLFADVV